MHDIFQQLHLTGIVPVIKITDVNKAVPLAQALKTGGLACAEITFRTAQAAAAIRAITNAMPDMLVGAGTVLTCAQADAAMEAGARFIVSPGLNPEVVRYCQHAGIPILPGCCTPGEIEQALSLGLDIVKFFPAEAAGGLEMVKALAAPYGDIRFVPTGGIGPGNLLSYLNFSKVLACGGSWMVKDEYIDAGAFDRIAQMTREAVDRMLGFEPVCIDIGGGESFSAFFGAGVLSGGLEAQTTPLPGGKGTIVIRTNFLHRAAHYLTQRGAVLCESAADTRGPASLTLKDGINGFAVQIKQA